jgi:signal transduction histidine kinase
LLNKKIKLITNFLNLTKGLSGKLVGIVLIVSSSVTLVLTLINLYSDYKAEVRKVDLFVSESLQSHKSTLELALWNFDEGLVTSHLDGLITLPGVLAAEVSATNIKIIRKNSDDKALIEKKLVLISPPEVSEQIQELGTLKVIIGQSYFIEHLGRNALWIFLSQFLKTILVTLVLLFLFQKNFVKPLHVITDYFHDREKANLENSFPELILKRKSESVSNDEFDYLVRVINSLLNSVSDYQLELRNLNRDLENKISLRAQELLDAQAKVDHNARLSAIGEMAAQVAHEVNNPLAIVSGKTQVLMAKMRKAGLREYDQDLIQIEKTVQRMVKIVRSLRILSRDSSNDRMKYELMSEIIDEALILFHEKLKSKQISLTLTGHDLGFSILCRKAQIEQVLVNLINNSIDALETLETRWLEIKIYVENNQLLLVITDSGPGISESLHQKIWQAFFTTKEVGKGTGIGLAISKKIIENHTASIDVDRSCENTAFVIRFKNYLDSGRVNEAS